MPSAEQKIQAIATPAKDHKTRFVTAASLFDGHDAAINIMRRCPPGPIFTLLDSRPWFTHVGDLHYRLSDSEYD